MDNNMENMDEQMRRIYQKVAKEVEEKRALERKRVIEANLKAAKEHADAEAQEMIRIQEEAALRARTASNWSQTVGVVTKFLSNMKRHNTPGSVSVLGPGWRKKKGWFIKSQLQIKTWWDDGDQYTHYTDDYYVLTDGSLWIIQGDDRDCRRIPLGRYGTTEISLERLLELLAENGLQWE